MEKKSFFVVCLLVGFFLLWGWQGQATASRADIPGEKGQPNPGGGDLDHGAAFKIESDGSVFHLLHEFAWSGDDGGRPHGSLIRQGATLYGMTKWGGHFGMGTVFKIGADGSGYELLHEFSGGADDGCSPQGSLVREGNTLYGMTYRGGNWNAGTVFKIGTDGSGFQLLHEFVGGADDGSYPRGSPVRKGNTLYGMTLSGGDSDCGTVFKIGTDGSGFELLHEFAGYPNDGRYPWGSLIRGGTSLYGMTRYSGGKNCGTVFKIGIDGSGYQLLHEFGGGADDGSGPQGSLIREDDTLYGMTFRGGDRNRGTIFKIDTDGSGFTLLHEFAGGADDGAAPRDSLAQEGTTLYGMTFQGGDSDSGTIFKIETDGSGFNLLHAFGGGSDDGSSPRGSLVKDGSTLYGMTFAGGDSDYGVVFSYDLPSITVTSPNGGEDWALGTVHDITWTASGLSNDVTIALLQNGIQVAKIDENIDPYLGSYTWTVGNCLSGIVTVGTGYKIVVRTKEGGSIVKDRSDGPFTITP
jgi:uncharacterized repeat protein (TIGR03803 family)